MNPSSITLASLESLEDLLANSCQTVRRIRLQSTNGDLSPEQAVELVADVAKSIAEFCGEKPVQYFRSKVNGAIRRYGLGVPAFRYSDATAWLSGNGIEITDLDELWDEIPASEGEV